MHRRSSESRAGHAVRLTKRGVWLVCALQSSLRLKPTFKGRVQQHGERARAERAGAICMGSTGSALTKQVVWHVARSRRCG